ncbi:3201_t:CDS:2 [Cetraspora pellucida]|uniref:3201_t:CDS:1 n=1 Tax=Cetraspora pellucida TaxID=1433469 RepID=A0A9N9JMZ4_9GLOM|nr:3201_t:CDS:2 [Cetraspora pellucida]
MFHATGTVLEKTSMEYQHAWSSKYVFIPVLKYIFERQHRGHITFSGDKIPSDESAIVISNHQSFSDFYMLHSVAIRRNMLPHVKYFAKDSLKYIPFFGFGMWLMGMIFIKRNWTRDESQLKKIFKTIKAYAAPIWIVNFVEGTRLTSRKLLESQRFAKERGLPILRNLLVPRTKGFVACVRQLRDAHVQYVYGIRYYFYIFLTLTQVEDNLESLLYLDFTIAYRHITQGFQFPPNLLQVHSYSPLSPPWSFHVHVRRYAIKDLPQEDEKLSEWVRQIFVEKDALLEDMKTRWTQSDRLDGVKEEKYF